MNSISTKSMRCIHFGSYWMGKNDIVFAMQTDLQKKCKATVVDVDLYSSKKKTWYQEDFSKSKIYPVRILSHKKVITLIQKTHPDFIICNAGGLCFDKETFLYVQKLGIITVGISLSDPDVFEDQGKNYAHLFDVFFTNSNYSLHHQYTNTNIHILPFAASKVIHKPLSIKKTCDIVVVGHARKERIELVSRLQKYFSVKTYGKGWGKPSKEVRGIEQVRAINEGKIYLSFPQTLAGFTNVKVGLFEAAACNSCIVVPFFDELKKYFTYGLDVLSFTNETMLYSLLHQYLQNDRLRSWIASNAYERFLSEHTWEKRWDSILDMVKRIKHDKQHTTS